MAREANLWLEKFSRDIGIKSAVLLFGNVDDLMQNKFNSGKYEYVLDSVIGALKSKGFLNVIKWDCVKGIDYTISNVRQNSAENSAGNSADDYDMGEDTDTNSGGPKYDKPGEFFPYLLEEIKDRPNGKAFIIDYSDYIFGNQDRLSEAERQYLSKLKMALEDAKEYNVLHDDFEKQGSVIVVIAKSIMTIPPSFYLNDSAVSEINVPLPARLERELFIENFRGEFRISNSLDDESNKNDFVDLLEGFSLKDIVQIMKLSRQQEEILSFEKLVNLYKFGEKTSPWEELSKEKLQTIEEKLKARVKGQDDAVEKVKSVIIRAFTGFAGLQHSAKQRKPKGTLFFVGPTGVGKTELAKALAEFVFGDEDACIRFDMSEFNHEQSDQRLIGAPPGYVGYEAGGQLTNAVKERPFCVLLFDEIEKAHQKILDKFLQILEDGRLTDGKGETVYFSETIIIFTSNIGAAKVSPDQEPEKIKAEFINEVRRHFVEELNRPELLNRIGNNIVAFNFIKDTDALTRIAESKFQLVVDFMHERYHVELVFENKNEAFRAIAKKADTRNGGRGLLNILEDKIINPLSEFVFEQDEILGRKIVIKILNERLAEFDFELA